MSQKTDKRNRRQIFDTWLKKYRNVFFKVIRSYAFNPQDRDDLFQEISIQVWNSIPNFKGHCSESTWLYRIAFNTAFTWSNANKKHMSTKQHIKSEIHSLIERGEERDPRVEWLYQQITGLNEIDRSVTLLLLDGYSYRDISEILGISETNVGVKINRIKKRLVEKSLEVPDYGVR